MTRLILVGLSVKCWEDARVVSPDRQMDQQYDLRTEGRAGNSDL